MAWVADQAGRRVAPCSTLTDFRGDHDVLVAICQLPEPGKSGKLTTRRGVYYPQVFDCTIRTGPEPCTGCGYDFGDDPTAGDAPCPDCGDCDQCCWENHGGDFHGVVVG